LQSISRPLISLSQVKAFLPPLLRFFFRLPSFLNQKTKESPPWSPLPTNVVFCHLPPNPRWAFLPSPVKPCLSKKSSAWSIFGPFEVYLSSSLSQSLKLAFFFSLYPFFRSRFFPLVPRQALFYRLAFSFPLFLFRLGCHPFLMGPRNNLSLFGSPPPLTFDSF